MVIKKKNKDPSIPFNKIKGLLLSHGLNGHRVPNQRCKESILNREFLGNLKELRSNWSAWRTALELAYGEVNPGKIFAPKNRAIIRQYINWIIDALALGTRVAAKRFSNLARERALLTDNHRHNKMKCCGISRDRLFLASSLSRGVNVRAPPGHEVLEEKEAAIRRLSAPRQLPPPEVLQDLKEFIRSTFEAKRAPKRYKGLPLPNGKACLELPSNKGGSQIAMTLYGQEEDVPARAQEIMARMEQCKEEFIAQEGFWDYYTVSNCEDWGTAALWFEYLELEQELANMTVIDIQPKAQEPHQSEMKFRFALPVEDAFRRAVADKSDITKTARVFTLITPEGKIRVPTMHAAGVTWQARAISTFLLQWLGKIHQTRTALKNKPLKLTTRAKNAFLFSADLSKSTDPISIDLARFVLDELIEVIGFKPEWWDDAISNVIQEFKIEGRPEEITCGALMGLGPSWTILSILNSFAAHRAGAKKGDHQTCGDDLIGLWTKTVIKAYQTNIELLGLENNLQKSYVSKRYGVFCERFIQTNRARTTAEGPEIVRIAEATGMKSTSTRKGRLIVDDLLKICTTNRPSVNHRLIKRACRRTAIALSPCPSTPGLLSQGGGGSTRPADLKTLIGYIRYGPISQLVTDSDPRVRNARKELREAETTSKGVIIEDVLTDLKSIIHRDELRKFVHGGNEVRLRSYKDVRSSVAKRRREATKIIKSSRSAIVAVREAILMPDSYVRFNLKLWKRIWNAVSRRQYVKAVTIAQASWKQTVSEETKANILLKYAPNHQPQPDVLLRPMDSHRSSTQHP